MSGSEPGPAWSPEYGYLLVSDGTLIRQLYLRPAKLAALAWERWAPNAEMLVLEPGYPDKTTRGTSRSEAAEMIGSEPLDQPGEGTPPPVDRTVELGDRARRLAEAIATTQEQIASDAAGVVEDLAPVEWASQTHNEAIDEAAEIRAAFRKLYRLWDELRQIETHVVRWRLERGVDS